jgi:hypothetical protein
VQFNSKVTVYEYPRALSRDIVVLDTPPPSPSKSEFTEPPRKRVKLEHVPASEVKHVPSNDKHVSSQGLEQIISQSDVKLKISSLQIWSPLSSTRPRDQLTSEPVAKDEPTRDVSLNRATPLTLARDTSLSSVNTPHSSVNGNLDVNMSLDSSLSPELISGVTAPHAVTLTYHQPPPSTRDLVVNSVNQGQGAMHYRDQTREHVTARPFPARTPEHVTAASETRDTYFLTPVQLPPSPTALAAKYSTNGDIGDIEDIGQTRAVTGVKVVSTDAKQASQVSGPARAINSSPCQIEHVTPSNQHSYLLSQEYRPIRHERRDYAASDLLAQMSVEIHGRA